MKKLLLLFNHQLTEIQRDDAEKTLDASEIVFPPQGISNLWEQLPPDTDTLFPLLEPIRDWILSVGNTEDYLLVQGDFGATCLMVHFALDHGIIPIYSTTERRAVEERLADGTVRSSHIFRHVLFRKYGQ